MGSESDLHVHNATRKRSPLLVTAMHEVESLHALDSVAVPVQRLVHAGVASTGLEDLLRGRQAGRALHPILTDLPLGAWGTELEDPSAAI